MQIYKQTALVKLSYKKQKDQSQLALLENQKTALKNELEELKNRSIIKQHAQELLGMEKMRLETVKRVIKNDSEKIYE